MNEFRELDIQIPGLNQNTIETKTHTLTWEETPDRFEPLQFEAEDQNEPVPDIYERIPGGKKYKLYLGNFESVGSENHKLYDKLRSAEPSDELEIYIASDGGYVLETMEFYNVIKPKFSNVITFLNRGYSGGSIAFLLGTERIVYERSDFMVHTYTGGAYGKREDMLQHAEHNDKMITSFFESAYSPFFSKKEMKRIHKGKDFWMDSEEMLRRGVATGIILDSGIYQTREEYLKEHGIKPFKKKKKKS